MSKAVPSAQLPERPNLEQLKKQAKELRVSGGHATLASAQRALAKMYGFASWPALALAVEQKTLRRLIEQGDATAVRDLVSTSSRLASTPFADGSAPLHVAAAENRPAVVEVLAAAGAPLHAKGVRWGHSALSWALTCWSFDAAQKLVELGVKPDLFCASGLGLIDAVKAFWPNGSLIRKPSATGSSRYDDSGASLPQPPKSDADQVSDALYIACRCDRLDVARWLLDHGADPNWRGYAGATNLAWAEFSGNAELCALLRARGGSDELLDQEFRSTPRVFALMVLTGWGFPRKLVERLTADPSLVASRGGRGTLLHVAAAAGKEKTATVLLHFGADRAAKNDEGLTAADVAAAKGHEALATMLR